MPAGFFGKTGTGTPFFFSVKDTPALLWPKHNFLFSKCPTSGRPQRFSVAVQGQMPYGLRLAAGMRRVAVRRGVVCRAAHVAQRSLLVSKCPRARHGIASGGAGRPGSDAPSPASALLH